MLSNISDGFLTINVILSFIFGVTLIVKSNAKNPTLFLGLFMITYFMEGYIDLAKYFLSESTTDKLLFIPFITNSFLFAPFLYLYAKNLMSPISFKKEIPHLIPGLIEFLLFSVLFCLSVETKKWLNSSEDTANYWFFYRIISFIYSIYYLFKTIKFIDQCQMEIENYYSTLEGKLLTWLRSTTLFLGTIGVVWLILFIIVNMSSPESMNLIGFFSNFVIDGINLLFIGYVTVMGLKQSSLIEFSQMKLEEKQIDRLSTINYTEKEENNQFYDQVLEYMETKEPFTNPTLTLGSLSSELNIQPRRLSEVIKKQTAYNFNQFINKFRVDKAKELLNSPQYAHYSILGIAEEAGFNSKATFNTTFKQFTQMTPSQFKKQIQE